MTWDLLAESDPELLGHALRLLAEEHGYVFLATTAADGSPRVHPVAPLVTATGAHLLISAGSPKLRDLRRDPRVALHSSVRPPDDEELSVRGAVVERDGDLRRRVAAARLSGAEPHDGMVLFELVPDRVLRTVWIDGTPRRTVWRATR